MNETGYFCSGCGVMFFCSALNSYAKTMMTLKLVVHSSTEV